MRDHTVFVAMVSYPGGTLKLSESGKWYCPENRSAEETANRVASLRDVKPSDGEPLVAQARLLQGIFGGDLITHMPRKRSAANEIGGKDVDTCL